LFSLVGAGRLGLPLGRRLSRCPGYRLVGVACGSEASAWRAVRRIGRGRPYGSATEAAEKARLVLICVPDRRIAVVASRLADDRPDWTGFTVLHTSGALDASELEPLARRGAQVGSLHPLQTFSGDRHDSRRLRHCFYAVEGMPAAVRTARGLIRGLGGRAMTVPPDAKTAYHLCACLLSNYLVSLVTFGRQLYPVSRLSASRWMHQFAPLMRTTLDNLERDGPERVLTGPLSRGDLDTLRRHLRHLRREPSSLRTLHRILALRAVELARSGARIDAATAGRLRRLLGSRRKKTRGRSGPGTRDRF
jgi:predicted short-subunit dehydrogenase-like oxidoreductase (DUF2520 family)